MKNLIKIVTVLIAMVLSLPLIAQNRDLDNFRLPDQRGIHDFETPKDSVTTFNGVQVRVGGASTLQFQSIDHENSGAVPLKEIGGNFNLATANLDLDVVLYDGVRMHLRTYLSSRHHPEPYVKGGYLQIDKLDFISPGFLAETMKYTTIKFGHMENNYGDAHFRRTDNAQAIYNPFVGNYIMDSFTTEVGAEIYYRRNGFIGMLGMTNGKLNQAVNNPETTSPSLLAKLGFDKQLDADLRVRVTGSVYHTAHNSRTVLYSGDRAGSRYYFVMENEEATSAGNFTSGRFNPGLNNKLTAIMVNPFVKYKGLEFFATYERAAGRTSAETEDRVFNQYGAELIYRFGTNEDFYLGGRYNMVSGELAGSGEEIDITRFQLGAGWFMTKNILAKVEYVTQKYDGFPTASILNEGQFNGIVFEAVISF